MSKAAEASPESLNAVREFPDRLPAIVVKELRQGLRARLFAEFIAGFHLLMLILLLNEILDGNRPSGTAPVRLVWAIIAILLVVFFPLRGLGALHSERQANTLDLLVLTNISPGRIVLGKWAAIAGQILLAALSLMPYVLFLYAGGGVPLGGSLEVLARLTLCGLTLTAVFTALSWQSSWIGRAGPALALVTAALTGFAFPLVGTLSGGTVPWLATERQLAAELAAASLLIYMSLRQAAGYLSEGRGNYSAGPRLAVPVVVGLAMAARNPVLGLAGFAALLLMSVSSLMECRPPRGSGQGPRPWWQRLPGLRPGWPDGVLWAAGVWSLLGAVVFLGEGGHGLNGAVWVAGGAACLFCGRLLLFLLPRSLRPQEGRALPLVGMGLLFWLLQAALVLGETLTGAGTFGQVAALVPSPVPMNSGAGAQTAKILLAVVSGLLCLLVAVTALVRRRKEETLSGEEGRA